MFQNDILMYYNSILAKTGRRGADDKAFPGLIWVKERDGVWGHIFGFPVDSNANCIFGLTTLLDHEFGLTTLLDHEFFTSSNEDNLFLDLGM
jgi:hypothetical protein